MSRFAIVAGALGGLLLMVPALPAMASTTHTISIAAAKSHHVSAPKSVHPGWTRIRDTGALPVEIWRSKGASLSTFVADINRKSGARLNAHFIQSGEFDPQYDGYVYLHAGTFYAVDAAHGKSKYTKSQVATFHVSGSKRNATLPKYDTANIASNYKLKLVGISKSRHYVRLNNASGRSVNLGAVRVGAHVSTAAINRFLAHPSVNTITQVSPDSWWGIAQFAGPHQSVVLPQFLSKGRWVFFTQAALDTGLQKTHSGQAHLVTIH
jgi:hypothetical protein